VPLQQLPERPQPRPPRVQQPRVQVPQLQPLHLQLPVVLLPEEAHLPVVRVEHQHLQTPDASLKTLVAAKTVAKATNQTKA
jgi:hypothetical protein